MSGLKIGEVAQHGNRRPLSGIEQLVWMATRRTPINFIVHLRLRGIPPRERVQAALEALRPRYRGLSARVVTDGKGPPQFTDEGVGPIPLEWRNVEESEAWQVEAARQLEEPFDLSRGPLARIVALEWGEHVDLLAVCDHSVADGISGINLLRDICWQLSDPRREVEPLPLPPSLHSMIPPEFRDTWRMRFTRRWGPPILRGIRRFDEWRRRLFGWPQPSPEDLDSKQTLDEQRAAWGVDRVRVRQRGLTPEQTRSVVETSRARGTTVHAALCVAFARVLVTRRPRWGKSSRRIESPINARPRLCPEAEPGAGLFNLLCPLPVRGTSSSDYWQSAREFRQRFGHETAGDRIHVGSTLMEELISGLDEDALRGWAAWMLVQDPPCELCISNLGRPDFPQQVGDSEVVGLDGPCVVGRFDLPVFGVATFPDRMTFCLTESKLPADGFDWWDCLDGAIRELLTHCDAQRSVEASLNA